MSGPVTPADATPEAISSSPGLGDNLEISESRKAEVGSLSVRRALPQRPRRTVGAWCFLDHAGPASVTEQNPVDIGPHPHMGLQTVTWLLEGRLLHRDSLGSEQLIRPGELNLMTAGAGVAHAEETPERHTGTFHAVQLWVAQPSETRNGAADFAHHDDLPEVELDDVGTATVLIGEFGGASSPARRDTDHVGVALDIPTGRSVLPLRADYEYALVSMAGTFVIGDQVLEPGHLGYLGLGRDELAVHTKEPTKAMLIGGLPFPEPVVMWWNYVGRDRQEIAAAHEAWTAGDDRFGTVDSPIDRVVVGPPPWSGPGN